MPKKGDYLRVKNYEGKIKSPSWFTQILKVF